MGLGLVAEGAALRADPVGKRSSLYQREDAVVLLLGEYTQSFPRGEGGMKGSNLSGLLQCRILTTIVQLAPWKLSFCLLKCVTLFYFLASRENRQIIRHNIEEVFAESCAKE